jgi:replicative DNA helicase
MNNIVLNPEAETAILSILLKSPALFSELSDLKEYMLSSTPNKVLFSVIKELIDQNLIPDANLIFSHLKSDNKEMSVGGIDYLNYLVKQDYNQENFKKYESIVVNMYKRQKMLTLASGIVENVVASDIDDLITRTKDSLDDLLVSSGNVSTVSIDIALKESWEQIIDKVEHPGISGVTTGLKNLDLNTNGIIEGESWVISGRPSMGKTAFICNMAYNQGKSGIPVLIVSRETRRSQLAHRLISIDTGIESSKIKFGTVTQPELDLISDSIKRIKEYPIHINSDFMASPEAVYSTIRKYHSNFGIKVAYMDYLQLLAERNSESTHELGKISRMFKLLANDLAMGCVSGSQLNRLVELRDDKRPVMSDLRQSGNIEEDADVVIALYRDIVYNKNTNTPDDMEVILLKQREGPIGTIFTNFNGLNYRIREK